jgi:uncharacterized protein YerC
MSEPRVIYKSEIVKLMNEGKKTKEVAKELGISVAKLMNIKKSCNLAKKRPASTPFEFINDDEPKMTTD